MKGVILAGGSGMYETLLGAAMFVETIKKRQGYKVIFNQGWLTLVYKKAGSLKKVSYGKYLMGMLNDV